ncbi:cytochrome c oxidase assembly protein [Amycolatopsis sp. NBRC 101858]|uniref:cytochrome c oxidase assembly protein n=1 Tax=Amycolatopsis sp. NBRC 101858 TaxID=3032200 RepID=UPI0024A12927|nr:cytochrome c oxidase assembly protein [Amycolatopsis sp. NBRC 101858]GLY42758.1 cytochrome c oxidase assembly protein [Amycolatopsis sp. NBRC 101858]
MPPLTWSTLGTEWDVPVLAVILFGGAVLAYAAAAVRLPGWPRRRVVAFLAGIALAVFAVGGAVNAYSAVLFSMHMAQHLLLIMVVPALLLLGRPLELIRGRVFARPLAALAHPAVGFACYTAVVVGTHLTPFQQSALTEPVVHGVEEALYLGSGLLLLLPLVGVRPGKPPLSHLARLVVLFGAMVVDAVVGVVLMMTPAEPFPAYAAVVRDWGPGPVEDLHWGGAAMWVGGDALMGALAVFVISRWMSAMDHGDDLGTWLESARRSALDLGEGTAVDDDEEALRSYNAMLARLAGRERGPDAGR